MKIIMERLQLTLVNNLYYVYKQTRRALTTAVVEYVIKLFSTNLSNSFCSTPVQLNLKQKRFTVKKKEKKR